MKNMLKEIKDWVDSSKCFFDLVMAIVVMAEVRDALTAWTSGNMGFVAFHIITAFVIVTAYVVVQRKRISEA